MSYGTSSLDYDSRQKAYWDTQLFVEGTIRSEVTNPNLLGGTAMTAVWTRTTPSGTIEDQAQYTIHYVMRPGTAGVSDQLSSADITAVTQDYMLNAWTPTRSLISSTWTLQETVWRDFGADFPMSQPDDPAATPPVHKYGPVRARTSQLSPGQGASTRLPDQVASTITFKTGSRKHWGRIYVGGFAQLAGAGSSFGRFTNTSVDQLANAFQAHFTSIRGFSREIEAVVWSSRYAAIMGVDQLQVDDVPDVIRRRRGKQAGYRKVL